MIGKTINNYVIVRKVGSGGMGVVYYARHNRVDREVAIKVLHNYLFTNENIRYRFKNEASALIALSHPNIVTIYDYVEREDYACLIMEYINGYTLDEYISKITGPLPAPKATDIIISVLKAVQYAHDKNIYHRDIKPGNIMISKTGSMVKIMDFGVAKLTGQSNMKTTHANAQLGTPFYMSPEQIKGVPLTPASDIYQLGVTLYEMVTGKCPYLDITNLFELQTKIVNEPLPPTSKFYPDVPLKIQIAINKATSKIPHERFQSCNEFIQFLLSDDTPVVAEAAAPSTKESKTSPYIKSQEPETEKKPKPSKTLKDPSPLQKTTGQLKRKEISRRAYLISGLIVAMIILAAGITLLISSNNPDNKKTAEVPVVVPDSTVADKANAYITRKEKTSDFRLEEVKKSRLRDTLITLIEQNKTSEISAVLNRYYQKPKTAEPKTTGTKTVETDKNAEPPLPAVPDKKMITDFLTGKTLCDGAIFSADVPMSFTIKNNVIIAVCKFEEDCEVTLKFTKTAKGFNFKIINIY